MINFPVILMNYPMIIHPFSDSVVLLPGLANNVDKKPLKITTIFNSWLNQLFKSISMAIFPVRKL